MRRAEKARFPQRCAASASASHSPAASGGGRDRHGGRAGRSPALRDLYRVYTRELGRDSASPPAPTSSPPSQRCSACLYSTPSPVSSSASASPCSCFSTAPRVPTSPTSARCPVTATSVTLGATLQATRLDGVVALRIESGLFFANADPVRTRITAAAMADGVRVVVLNLEAVPSLDVSAARMLASVAEDLRREGVELRLARVVGQSTTSSTGVRKAHPRSTQRSRGCSGLSRGSPPAQPKKKTLRTPRTVTRGRPLQATEREERRSSLAYSLG
jgi:anti-anti-sigma factor